MRSGDRSARQRLDPEERRGAILAAATRAFSRGTYDQTSVAAIAAASGASEALAYRYFVSKAGLYAAVVKNQLDRLATSQHDAVARLGPNSSARDQVRVMIEALLDHVQGDPPSWASPFFIGANEPTGVEELRRQYRLEFATVLAKRVDNPTYRRAQLAITGFIGHLGAAAQQWVTEGCPAADRGPLIEAALGSLQGGLGDWGVLQG